MVPEMVGANVRNCHVLVAKDFVLWYIIVGSMAVSHIKPCHSISRFSIEKE